MSDDNSQIGIFTLTKPVIMMFSNLYVPRRFKGKNGVEVGEPKYDGTFVFEPDSEDWTGLKKTAATIARAKDPNVDLKTLQFPFKSGNKMADKRKAKGKDDGEWLRGKGILTPSSKNPPRLSVFENRKILDLDDDQLRAKYKGHFYGGVEVYAQFNLVWYDAVKEGDRPGITSYLNHVLSTNKGKRIGGGAPGSEVFKGYAGGISTEDPTAGIEDLDDEIPF